MLARFLFFKSGYFHCMNFCRGGERGVIGRREIAIFFLILIGLLVRLWLAPPVWHHGEAREGLVVQGLLRDHQWILPLRNDHLPSKPPLFHWIAALLAIVLGFSDFILRLPSVLGALLMAGAVFALSRTLFDRTTAWLSVGALLAMYEFWDSATQARVDMLFSACITLCLTAFFLWYRGGNGKARVACYLSAALAVLAKGPAGMVLPVLVIGVFLTVEGQLRMLWKFWSWPLAILVLGIDAGWYALAYRAGGSDFLALQLVQENVDRALGTGSFESPKNGFFSITFWLMVEIFPWSLVIPWSMVRRLKGHRENSAGRFLHAWWAVIFLVFALAAGKRAVYLLPLYPAIALLAARRLNDLLVRPAALAFGSARPRRFSWRIRETITLRRVASGIAILDLLLVLVNHNRWHDAGARQARLAFIDSIDRIVPASRKIAASKQINRTDVFVIAYAARSRDQAHIVCRAGTE